MIAGRLSNCNISINAHAIHVWLWEAQYRYLDAYFLLYFACRIVAGDWLGPWTLCHALAKIANSVHPSGLRIHLATTPGGGAPVLYTAWWGKLCSISLTKHSVPWLIELYKGGYSIWEKLVRDQDVTLRANLSGIGAILCKKDNLEGAKLIRLIRVCWTKSARSCEQNRAATNCLCLLVDFPQNHAPSEGLLSCGADKSRRVYLQCPLTKSCAALAWKCTSRSIFAVMLAAASFHSSHNGLCLLSFLNSVSFHACSVESLFKEEDEPGQDSSRSALESPCSVLLLIPLVLGIGKVICHTFNPGFHSIWPVSKTNLAVDLCSWTLIAQWCTSLLGVLTWMKITANQHFKIELNTMNSSELYPKAWAGSSCRSNATGWMWPFSKAIKLWDIFMYRWIQDTSHN